MLLPNRRKDVKEGAWANENLAILATILKCTKKMKEIKNMTRQKAIGQLILQDMYKTFDVKNADTQEYSIRVLLSLLEDSSFLSSTFFVIDSLLSHD